MGWYNRIEKAVDVLHKAMGRAGVSVFSSRRLKKWQGKPGEIIAKMSEEDKEKLRELKSDDISSGAMGRDADLAAYTGYQESDEDKNRYEQLGKELKLKFDEKIVK